MEELTDEISAIQSIFPDELSFSSTESGNKVVHYRINGDLVLSLEIVGMLILVFMIRCLDQLTQ